MAGPTQPTVRELHGRGLDLASAGDLRQANSVYRAAIALSEDTSGYHDTDPLFEGAIQRDLGALSLRYAIQEAAKGGDADGTLVDGYLGEAGNRFQEAQMAHVRLANGRGAYRGSLRNRAVRNERGATWTWQGRGVVVHNHLQASGLPCTRFMANGPDISQAKEAFLEARREFRRLGLFANPYYKASLGMHAARLATLSGEARIAAIWRQYALWSLGLAAVQLDAGNARSAVRTIVSRWKSATDPVAALESLAVFTSDGRPNTKAKI